MVRVGENRLPPDAPSRVLMGTAARNSVGTVPALTCRLTAASTTAVVKRSFTVTPAAREASITR